MACKSNMEIDCLKLQLNREFEIKDLREAQENTWDGDLKGNGEGQCSPYTENIFEESA